MKLIGFVFGSIIFVIALGILVVQAQKGETDVTLKKTKVAMIMNGSRDDHSWGESHYIAMEQVASQLNLDVAYYENTLEDSTAEKVMEQAIAGGARILIANSFNFGNSICKVAERHPAVKFFHATGLQTKANLASFFGRIYQMRYLAGVVAGLTTETNEIGYVAAFDISEVNRGINAFTLGVRKVNPKATVFVSWSHSWVDPNLASDATNDLLRKHNIDVLTLHLDAIAPYEIAEQKNVKMIGYNLDNSKRYPKNFLTAPVWRWENYYAPHIMAVLQDKFVGENSWLGVESGIVSLAPLTDLVPDSVKQVVETELNQLRLGKYDVFYGPIEDNHGTLRVGEGESMTDTDMLEHFDWYVNGVVSE